MDYGRTALLAAAMLTGACSAFTAGSDIADLSQFCEDFVNEPPQVKPEGWPGLWATCMQENGASCSQAEGTIRCTLESEDGSGSASVESPF